MGFLVVCISLGMPLPFRTFVFLFLDVLRTPPSPPSPPQYTHAQPTGTAPSRFAFFLKNTVLLIHPRALQALQREPNATIK